MNNWTIPIKSGSVIGASVCDKKGKSGKPAPTESDRQDEQDGYDGTDDTLRTDSVDANRPQEHPDKPRVERDLYNLPDFYKRMGVVGDP